MTQAGTLVDTLLLRCRDLNAVMFGDTPTTRATIRRYLSEAQKLTSVGAELVVDEHPFATVIGQTLYNSDQQILRIHNSDFELKQCMWEELGRADRGWLIRQGQTIRVFARIGIDLFALYPRPAGVTPTEVTLVVNQVPDRLNLDTDELIVPQEAEAALLNMAEALVMLRRRMLDFAQAAIARLMENMKLLGLEVATPPVDLPSGSI